MSITPEGRPDSVPNDGSTRPAAPTPEQEVTEASRAPEVVAASEALVAEETRTAGAHSQEAPTQRIEPAETVALPSQPGTPKANLPQSAPVSGLPATGEIAGAQPPLGGSAPSAFAGPYPGPTPPGAHGVGRYPNAPTPAPAFGAPTVSTGVSPTPYGAPATPVPPVAPAAPASHAAPVAPGYATPATPAAPAAHPGFAAPAAHQPPPAAYRAAPAAHQGAPTAPLPPAASPTYQGVPAATPAQAAPAATDALAVFRSPGTAPAPDGAQGAAPAAGSGVGGPGYPPVGAPIGADGQPAAEPKVPRNRQWLPLVAAGVVVALVSSFGTAALTGAFSSTSSNNISSTNISQLGQSTTDSVPVSGSTVDNPDWQAVSAAVRNSVVAIQVATSSGGAEGSGVIADSDGNIITNNHVVSGATQVQVTLTDGRIYAAEVVGTDTTTDLAVIRLTDAPDDLSPAAFGDSDSIAVGDPVMAVGNPLGLANTVTTGIVSALDRPVSTTESGSLETVVTNAIQIDAAINPGNSGGPLFDAQGRVIGIASSIATTSAQSGSIGLGFAIPITLASKVASQLVESGVATHAFLGVGLADTTATADGVTRAGAGVSTISDGSPAVAAGLQVGDAIVAIDGKPVGGAESLTGYVRAHTTGDEVTLTVVRDGKALSIDVTLAAREETGTPSGSSGSGQDGSSDGSSDGSGSGLENMTPDELWQWFQQQQGGQG